MYWQYMSEQVGYCILCMVYNSLWYSIWRARKAEALKQHRCRGIDDGKQNETVVCAYRCRLETWSLRAVALLCGKRKCISNSRQFLSSRLQLANLQAAWIMHGYLAVSCCPPRFLPQWTGIPHRKQAPGGFEPDALIKAALAALKSFTSVWSSSPFLLPFAERRRAYFIKRSAPEFRGAAADYWICCAALCALGARCHAGALCI